MALSLYYKNIPLSNLFSEIVDRLLLVEYLPLQGSIYGQGDLIVVDKPEFQTWGIGKRLRELRELMGMSLADVRDATGISDGLISKYEREIVTPSWTQIERLIDVLDQNPCALFSDICKSRGDSEDTFRVHLYASIPPERDGASPSNMLNVPKHSPLWRLLQIVPTDDRYSILIAQTDRMYPLWTPGDLLIFDQSADAQVDQIIAGYYKDKPMLARLIRYKKHLCLSFANRQYGPPFRFERKHWEHGGCLVYVIRNMQYRYVSPDEFDEGGGA